MKKAVLFLALVTGVAIGASAQHHALPDKYAGSKTITLFDSTGVYMEESGLSHVLTHKLIRMNSSTAT